MDKGLIRIKELEGAISELEKSELATKSKTGDVVKAYKKLMRDIDAFEVTSTNLNQKKQQNLEAPQKRKTKKVALIKSIIFAYISVTLICLLVVIIGSAGTVSVSQCLLSTLAIFAPVCGIAIPIEFKSINKNYPIVDSAEIEEQILSNNKNLESAYSKKIELDNVLLNLKNKSEDFREEIRDLQREIDSIETIRANIIKEFCNNNPELDKKIDDAYDKSKVKEKVK